MLPKPAVKAPHLANRLTSWGSRSGAQVALCMLAGTFMSNGFWTAAWACVAGVGVLLAWSFWTTLRDAHTIKHFKDEVPEADRAKLQRVRNIVPNE